MGSPISSTISELVLNVMENLLIKPNPDITFYKRYVDDIIICAHASKINNIFNLLNNYHPRLKFTLEKENNKNSINFLDITLIRSQSGIIYTNWYRKNTKTTRYINFHSYTATKYKRSIITNLVDHAIILSDTKFHEQNIKYIIDILLINDYPLNFITKNIHKRLNYLKIKNRNDSISLNTNFNNNPNSSTNQNIHNTNISQNTNPILQINQNFNNFSTIPYIPFLSEKIAKVLQPFNIHTSFINHNTLGKNFFSSLKDKTPIDLQSNLIYSIPCNNCNSVYIGQTKQYLKKRIYQHKQSIKTKLTSPNKPNTALSDHAIDNLHNFNFNSTKIIHHESNLNKRLMLECLEIKKSPTSINYRSDLEKFNSTYDYLIKKLYN